MHACAIFTFSEDVLQPRKANTSSTRQPWKEEEEEELKEVFSNFFRLGKNPKEKDIRKAMAESKEKEGALFKNGRTNWETIKKKVIRMIKISK